MSMSKKDFIALADAIREHNGYVHTNPFTQDQLNTLAHLCNLRNPRFNRERWLGYIVGNCGPNGGKV